MRNVLNNKLNSSFFKGFLSAFDLYGSNFTQSYRKRNVIDKSWSRVGGYFSKTF
ncbi:hypothetical protein [Thalassobellus citreus]|uniref:hypothetical protein n=1 Tax=Thalassobellus citreus TaxID=3367752 RepID=UPI0037974824